MKGQPSAQNQWVRWNCAVRIAGAAALLLPLSSGMLADSILLRGGEKVIGKVLSEEAAKVVFDSQTLGRIDIPRDRIERIERDAQAPPTEPGAADPTPKASASSHAFQEPVLTWTTALPGEKTFDWIQLKSGEWLKGKVKSLQDEKLEFDSEELDLLTFDWKDIRAVRSPRLNSVRLEGGGPINGAVVVTTNQVRIITPTATNSYPRTDLIAIAPTGNREIDKWTGTFSAGVSFRAGNTHETDVNSHAALQRRTPDTRLSLDYLGNYGKVNGIQNEQNHQFTGQYDSFLSRRLYVRLPDIQYFRDPLQNLDHRLTLGGGVGYDLIKKPRTEWNLTLGPAWQGNWFDSVPPGEEPSVQSLAVVLATRLDIEVSQRLDWIFEYRGQVSRKETGDNTHHAIATLEFEIHKTLKLDLSFQWLRITSPKTESDGSTPEPDDFRLITSFGVDF